MRAGPQNATARDARTFPSPRGDGRPAGPHRLSLDDTRDLVRSVGALALFAENHGFMEAELLVRDLLEDLTGPAPR